MERDSRAGDARAADSRWAGSGIGTACVHSGDIPLGEEPHPGVPPVYQATTYYFDRAASLEAFLKGEREGNAYSRWGTVTNACLESAISTLVGGEGLSITTASGMAANFAALQAAGLGRGKKALISREIYGNSYDILKSHFERNGAECAFADFKDRKALAAMIESEAPDIVFFEVLANPTLSVVDAPFAIEAAHAAGAKVVVDNTFATPYLYKPFLGGADFETHSLTKYLSGHGDVLGGSVTCGRADFRNLEAIVCTQGCVLSPDAARLVMRGLATFALRMERHCSNAKAAAAFLEGRPEVAKVRFPGLPSDPFRATAERIFKPGSFGGMLCLDLASGGKDAAFAFIDALRLFTPAGSLGDVKSLIVHPSSTTHHGLSPEEKARIGISDSTLRLSLGIEEERDIIEDLSRGLEAARLWA